MQILIVCSAGASSTFVSQRLQRAAKNEGTVLSARAGTWGGLVPGTDTDLVLIGPHLSEKLSEARALLSPIPVDVLPEECIRDLTGRLTLSFVTREGVGSSEAPPARESEGTP